ncbi:MAG: hypothetical protein KDD64_00105 [Bdellovibrionales bacterium]|nr:hypothetical protein [Bdellovibrionales bacterium]
MTEVLLIILALIGAFLIFWILKSVLTALPIPGLKRGFFERWKLRRSQRVLGEIDKLIDQQEYARAIQLFPSCLYLDLVRSDSDLIGRVGAHHVAVLNKTILLSDLMERPLSDLAILEDLLNTRIQLLRAWFELRGQRQGASRKSAPKWAREEFRKKEDEISSKLQLNASTVLTQFERSLEAVAKEGGSQSVTYH